MANSTATTTVSFGSAIAVGSVSATMSRPTIDATPLGQDYMTMVQGTNAVQGTCDIFFDKTTHAAFVDNVADAAGNVAMTITWDTGDTWAGNARVSDITVTASKDDIVRATVSWVGSGSWISGV